MAEASDRSGQAAARWRSMTAISFGTEVFPSKASLSSALQNCGSSAMEVRWPLMVSERFSKPPLVFEAPAIDGDLAQAWLMRS